MNTGEFQWFFHEGTVANQGPTLASGQANGSFQQFVEPTLALAEAVANGLTNMNIFPIDGPVLEGDNKPCKRTKTRACLTPRPASPSPDWQPSIQNLDRFQVDVAWRDATGSGAAVSAPLTSDQTSLFCFLNPANSEMLTKIIDGCDENASFWVFAAAATDVEYTLTVTDTITNQMRMYGNELGQAATAVTDTTAFATCP